MIGLGSDKNWKMLKRIDVIKRIWIIRLLSEMIKDSEAESENVKKKVKMSKVNENVNKVRSVANLDGADAKLNWIFNAFDKDGHS